MAKFSLDNFIQKSEKPTLLEGVKAGTIYEDVYYLVLERIEEVERLIESTSSEELSELGAKSIKIVVSKITESLNKDKSNVRLDRCENLQTFITEQNKRLTRLWNSKLPNGGGKRPSKSELENELEILKVQLDDERQRQLHAYFNKAVESEIINTHKNLVEHYTDTKRRYREEQAKNELLSQKITGLVKELNVKKVI